MMLNTYRTDFLIVGAGIIGLAIANELRKRHPKARITILEKERDVGYHSSGRNSGVVHAGFYYTADSLKAKFTRTGNIRLTEFCQKNGLRINKAGKVVVARNSKELGNLHELKKRGVANCVETYLVDEEELHKLEPKARTNKNALYSPSTSTVDPIEIVEFLKGQLIHEDVEFRFSEEYKGTIDENTICTKQKKRIRASSIINCAGLYADKVAKKFGFSSNYTIIPFKGVYITSNKASVKLKRNIYPVPKIENPFLGVHFTVAIDGKVKIGPTAIPALWRENYAGLQNLNIAEIFQIMGWETRLFLENSFGFRDLAIDEVKKYFKSYLVHLAGSLVRDIDLSSFDTWTSPGIRAQLLNTKTKELVQDFIVEGNKRNLHILNAVSPAFTCCFPFAEYIVGKYFA